MKSSIRVAATLSILLLTQLSFGQLLDWVYPMGNGWRNNIEAVHVDSAGNVYTVGFGNGVLDLDPGPGVDAYDFIGYRGAYIQKFDSSGAYLWGKPLTSVGYSATIDDLVVDKQGNVLILGYFSSFTDFDPGSGTQVLGGGGIIHVLLKLDHLGNFRWVINYGGVDVRAITTDDASNVYVVGAFASIVDFDPGPDTSYFFAAGTDGFVLKLDSAKNFQWLVQQGGEYLDAQDIVVAKNGSVNVLGNISGAPSMVDVDPGPGQFLEDVGFGSRSTYLLQLDDGGDFEDFFVVRSLSTGISANCHARALAQDKLGNTFVVGQVVEGIDLDMTDGEDIAWFNGYGTFICKMNHRNEYQWGIIQDVTAEGLVVDSIGNPYIMGTYGSNVDFDPGPGTHFEGNWYGNSFIQKLGTHGDFLGVQTFQGDYCRGRDMALDPWANLYVVGEFEVTTDFDPGPGVYSLTPQSTLSDGFIYRSRPCTPTAITTQQVTGCNDYTVNGIAYDTSGIYVQTLGRSGSCDSVLIVDLTIEALDTTVSINADTLIANAQGATYQWMSCGWGYNAIPGATNQELVIPIVGYYAVEINLNGCIDTSACIFITQVPEMDVVEELMLYPNPTNNYASVSLTLSKATAIEMEVYNSAGQRVAHLGSGMHAQGNHTFSFNVADWRQGMYLLVLKTEQGIVREQFSVIR